MLSYLKVRATFILLIMDRLRNFGVWHGELRPPRIGLTD
jgi:hypothetical protein